MLRENGRAHRGADAGPYPSAERKPHDRGSHEGADREHVTDSGADDASADSDADDAGAINRAINRADARAINRADARAINRADNGADVEAHSI